LNPDQDWEAIVIKQIVAGGGVFALCVAVHAWFMLWSVKVIGPKLQRQGTSLNLITTMVAVVTLLAAAHFIEVGLWASAMSLTGAVAAADGPLYFAFTSYTTLGYGDVIAHADWRLLGPTSAMNGILLFGWSTAVIFQVLQGTLAAQKAGFNTSGERPER
jgi:hypothetical protein